MANAQVNEDTRTSRMDHDHTERSMPRGVSGLNGTMPPALHRHNRRCQQIRVDPPFDKAGNSFPWMAELIDLKNEKWRCFRMICKASINGKWGCYRVSCKVSVKSRYSRFRKGTHFRAVANTMVCVVVLSGQ